jgi:hypothetical protein
LDKRKNVLNSGDFILAYNTDKRGIQKLLRDETTRNDFIKKSFTEFPFISKQKEKYGGFHDSLNETTLNNFKDRFTQFKLNKRAENIEDFEKLYKDKTSPSHTTNYYKTRKGGSETFANAYEAFMTDRKVYEKQFKTYFPETSKELEKMIDKLKAGEI